MMSFLSQYFSWEGGQLPSHALSKCRLWYQGFPDHVTILSSKNVPILNILRYLVQL